METVMSDRTRHAGHACAGGDESVPGARQRKAARRRSPGARPLSATPADPRGDRVGTVHPTAPKGRGDARGLDPATRVLTADLRWIAAADVAVGQELVACDEHAPPGGSGRRKMLTAVVESVRRTSGPAHRVVLDDGRLVVCSGAHAWLSRKSSHVGHWRSIEGSGRQRDGRDRLGPGDLVRAIGLPWGASDMQDGWFGGIIDGEGTLEYLRCKGARLAVYQCDGPVLVRMVGHCIARRYPHRVFSNGPHETGFSRRPVHSIRIATMSTLFRVLGQSRPVRFIGVRWWEGRGLPQDGWRAIVAIEPLGQRELVEIRTSTRTVIAGGFASHDSSAADAILGRAAAGTIGASALR